MPWLPSRGPLEGFLEGRLREGGVTAAGALVGDGERVVAAAAAGLARRQPREPASLSTRFDLASLTKPVTATLALALEATGDLPLRLPVGELFPGAHPRLARRPLEALLRHRAGLRPWAPLPLLLGDPGRDELVALITGGALLGAPPETYSDLGYLLWGLAAERALGAPLERLLAERLRAPLGLGGPVPPPGAAPGVAECRLDSRREVELAREQGLELDSSPPPAPGRVQDGNARWLGGYCGHAGLFGSVGEVWEVARLWLTPRPPLTAERVERALAGGRRFCLGWGRRRVRGSAGAALSAKAFGWVGFTGGSVWVDPEQGMVVVLLAHRTSEMVELAPWRRRFHRLAVEMIGCRPGSRPS